MAVLVIMSLIVLAVVSYTDAGHQEAYRVAGNTFLGGAAVTGREVLVGEFSYSLPVDWTDRLVSRQPDVFTVGVSTGPGVVSVRRDGPLTGVYAVWTRGDDCAVLVDDLSTDVYRWAVMTGPAVCDAGSVVAGAVVSTDMQNPTVLPS